MNKNLFFLLLVLMSLSLIGIIFVQGYWIKNTVNIKEEQFSFNAKQILRQTAKEIERQELENYYFALQEIVDSLGVKTDINYLSEVFKGQNSINSEENSIYSRGFVNSNLKLSEALGETAETTIHLKKLVNTKVTEIVEQETENANNTEVRERLNRIFRMNDVEKEFIRATVMDFTNTIPIHNRVSKPFIEKVLSEELKRREMKTSFEYGVYGNGLETKVQSDNFKLEAPSTYRVPLFASDNGTNNYDLYVNFTGKKQEVLSSITFMAVLSVIFTLIIVIAYSSALSQLIKQRQISEIKTDFINNMTHEFKTPIATINLALDSIKNPKIASSPDKIANYHRMIREENKRMHAQVENVLRISRLEKNELDLKKERINLHEIINEAITHVELIIEDREGYIKTHFGAFQSHILANESHFCNVIVNLLDNAVKYSEDEPKIDLYTENARNFIVLKIRDQGAGMSRAVQKKIFEKFYREHTGDIHNVKGHGLGLSYVKRILEDHHGEINVESERGKGSTFIIKLPLIS